MKDPGGEGRLAGTPAPGLIGSGEPMSSHGHLGRRPSAALLLTLALPAAAATVSGTVLSPISDNGYRAALDGAVVRVEGTHLAAPVVPLDPATGTFRLEGVPAGAVTLRFVEREGYDSFSHASLRRPLTVDGDVADVGFSLVPHWRLLPSYPPPWHDPNYDIWQPFFLSDQVGFLLFYGRWLPTQLHELWRTVDGGAHWARIGLWEQGASPWVPTQAGEQAVFFFDADHGVVSAAAGPPNYASVGLLWTADGGATWTGHDLENVPASATDPVTYPGGNGLVTVVRYAAIDASHGIACGAENVGSYMGSGAPGYVTVWETADAGATWSIATSWREDYGTCSALTATPDGHAILLDTPYAFGGSRQRLLRDPAGAWTPVAGNGLVTNSGYGGADVPMLGATAWLSGQRFDDAGAVVEQGLWRSEDWGATWTWMSELQVRYFGFATPRRGFALGGRAVATYDGGATWLHQSDGGGVCCHGNHLWVFDATRAIWHEGGPGDPNGVTDLFTYVEPLEPDLEVRGGVALADRTLPARVAAQRVPVLSLRLDGHGPVPLRLRSLALQASGSGDDHADLLAVRLWLDADGDGALDDGEAELAAGAFPADDGRLVLPLQGAPLLEEYQPLFLLVTSDLRAISSLRTYAVALAAADLQAETAGGAEAVQVAATAPPGTTWRGATLTVEAQADLQVTATDAPDPVTLGGTVTYTLTVRDAGPDDAAQVVLTDLLPVGATFVSAAASQGGCTRAAGTLTCALGTLAAGATATVEVVVRPDAAGALVNQASVAATEPDPSSLDNAASEATTVTEPPAQPEGGGGGCGCGGAAAGPGGLLLAALALRPRRPARRAGPGPA